MAPTEGGWLSSRALRVALVRARGALALAAIALTVALATAGPGSGAATAPTIITATITSATTLSIAGCPTETSPITDFGPLLPGASSVTTADCTVTFGSNNDTAALRMFQGDGLGVAMWKTTGGTLDTAFDGDGKVMTAGTWKAEDVVAQGDGKLVVGGYTATGNFAVARYGLNGALDATFDGDGIVTVDTGGGGNDEGQAVALQPDGKIVVAGYEMNGDWDATIARLNTNGALDTTFDGDGIASVAFSAGLDWARSVAIDSQGRIVIAGVVDNGGVDDCGAARLTPAGALDTTFDGDGKQVVACQNAWKMALQADDKVLLAGTTTAGNNFQVARLTTGGALDATFDTDGVAQIDLGGGDMAQSVTVQSDGKIVLAGRMWDGVDLDIGVARLTTAGAADATFSGDGALVVPVATTDDQAYDVIQLRDGALMVSGSVVDGSDNDLLLARITSAGVLDTTRFGSPNGYVYTEYLPTRNEVGNALLELHDGKVVAVGTAWNGSGDSFGVFRYTGTEVLDYAGGTADWSAGANAFGACLRAVAAGASTDGTTWTVDGDGDCADGNPDPWRPVVTTSGTGGAKVAQSTTAGATTAQASLRFGLRTSASQASGAYRSPVTFEVVAPNV